MNAKAQPLLLMSSNPSPIGGVEGYNPDEDEHNIDDNSVQMDMSSFPAL